MFWILLISQKFEDPVEFIIYFLFLAFFAKGLNLYQAPYTYIPNHWGTLCRGEPIMEDLAVGHIL